MKTSDKLWARRNLAESLEEFIAREEESLKSCEEYLSNDRIKHEESCIQATKESIEIYKFSIILARDFLDQLL